MKYLIIVLTLQIASTMSAQKKTTLIYVGDPMCSWCYGFSPEIDSALKQLGDDLDVELVMGGLRPYNKETMKDLKGFLTGHWEHVHDASNQPFNYGILDTDLLYDTEPSCRAVMIVRELAPDMAMQYFHKVQHAFYEHNLNPHLTSTYSDIAGDMGLDAQVFTAKFESDEYKKKIKQDFLRASQLGVRSFPTVLLTHNGETEVLSQGYSKAADLVAKVKKKITQ